MPRLMMVDDDAFNMLSHQAFLLKWGVEVDLFTCGEAAIKAYEESLQKTCCKVGYPLIITDIKMTEVCGFQVGERVLALKRKHQDLPHPLTLLALTSHVDKDVKKRTTEIGFKQTYEKPMCIEKMGRLVNRYYKPYHPFMKKTKQYSS